MKCLIVLMKDQRTLADDPAAEKANFEYNLIPVGLAYISAVLKENNHNVTILNLNHLDGSTDTIIKNDFSKNSYDVVITGGLSPFYPNIQAIVDAVRKYAPGIKIILGGGLISSQPEIMVNLLKPDFAVIGEGEQTLKELLECLEKKGDVAAVNGLIYRNAEGVIVRTKPRDPIRDLDALPWPDYEGFGYAESLDHLLPSVGSYYDVFDEPRVYPMISSRSCPFVCTFCFHPLGNKYRQRSVDNIMQEIEYAVKKYRINIILFYDELLAQNRDRITELCKRIKEFSSTLPWELKWICQMRVEYLEEDVVREMKDAGCYFFSLGLESYSPTVLKSMKKKITPQQIDTALRTCKRVGISYTGNFIFGDIAETKETYQETLNYWKNNRDLCETCIGMMPITIYQGSYIYQHAVKKGIIKDEIEFIKDRAKNFDAYLNPVNFTDAMTDEEYQQMLLDFKSASAIYKYYVTPLVNIQTEDRHEVQVKCPYCKEISTYKNYRIPEGFVKIDICCRKCRSRFIIPGQRLRLKFFIVNLFGYQLTYGVAKRMYDFADYLPLSLKIRIKKILEV
jgi:anaerobic magnesium-protoporphyrin IX monomethyl ester cyclase